MQSRHIVFVVAALSACVASESVAPPGNSVTIGGEDFLIFFDTQVARNDSVLLCVARNSTLVSFDRPGRYEAITNWSFSNDMYGQTYWTDAFRPANSKEWLWENSGERINEFPWGLQQPDLENSTDPLCIFVSGYWGGFFDDDCSAIATFVICQEQKWNNQTK